VGDFVFVVWDAEARTLTVARDHMGQRHLFYHEGEGFFAFATEMKGLWALPGGSVGVLDAGGRFAWRRYWEPHADPAHEGRDEAYYIRTYREVLAEAVACRLRRAVYPGGLFMGGGFDTSAICALAGPVVGPQGRKFIAAASVMPEENRNQTHTLRDWVEICRRDMPHLEV